MRQIALVLAVCVAGCNVTIQSGSSPPALQAAEARLMTIPPPVVPTPSLNDLAPPGEFAPSPVPTTAPAGADVKVVSNPFDPMRSRVNVSDTCGQQFAKAIIALYDVRHNSGGQAVSQGPAYQNATRFRTNLLAAKSACQRNTYEEDIYYGIFFSGLLTSNLTYSDQGIGLLRERTPNSLHLGDGSLTLRAYEECRDKDDEALLYFGQMVLSLEAGDRARAAEARNLILDRPTCPALRALAQDANPGSAGSSASFLGI